jgi:hypothetical protein
LIPGLRNISQRLQANPGQMTQGKPKRPIAPNKSLSPWCLLGRHGLLKRLNTPFNGLLGHHPGCRTSMLRDLAIAVIGEGQ